MKSSAKRNTEIFRRYSIGGESYGDIAVGMGITRATVAGVIFREQHKNDAKPAQRKANPKPIAPRVAAPSHLGTIEIRSGRFIYPPQPAEEPAPIGKWGAFPDASNACRFMHGDTLSQRSWRCCGHKTFDEKSHCLFHCHVVFDLKGSRAFYEKREAA